MRKFIAVIILLSSITGSSFAQDLIVTDAGDSLDCKITRLNNGIVYFHVIQGDQPPNTSLKSDQIQSMERGYFSTAPASVSRTYKPRFHWRIPGGGSQRIAKISDDMGGVYTTHLKSQKSGYQIELGGTFYPMESLGLGLKYIGAWYSYSISDLYVAFPDGSNELTDISDNITVQYFGPSLIPSLFVSNNLIFRSGISIGYLGYQETG